MSKAKNMIQRLKIVISNFKIEACVRIELWECPTGHDQIQ